MATAEYIGALISLVSKSDIRYQGLLASINPNEATIALEKVRSWGTEGRVAAQGRPQEEIPPSDHVYDYIMFRAADVKDLKIDDPNPPKQQPAPPQPALNDPAILGSSAQAPGAGGRYGMMPPPPASFGAAPFPGAPGSTGPPSQQTSAPGSQNKSASPAPPSTATKPSTSPSAASSAHPAEKSSADKVLEEMSKLSVSKPPSTSQASTSPSTLPSAVPGLPAIPHAAAAAAKAAAAAQRPHASNGNGGARGGGAAREGRTQRDVIGGPSMPNKEFDFESANAKFQKHSEAGEAAATNGDASNGGAGLLDSIPPAGEKEFYDKSGFFDNISSEVKERYERNDQPRGGVEQGDGGFFDVPGGRGGRGGRGGGGRGRGRAGRMAEEMKNMQTFGDTGASTGGGGRGGRGRGRGGRGRGRGGQRGAGAAGTNGFTGPMRQG
ncbi:Protein SCD6 [Pseudozyma hubeiensis]|nr:Protein SCD6 [Pseudozyma hubeiensis]